jgi:hypothetical protein
MASLDLTPFAPKPTPLDYKKQLRTKLLQLATTNNFMCHFNLPDTLKKYLKEELAFYNDVQQETINLLCCDASLPGSTLYTHDVNNVFPGVNEKFAYARAYDDRASFDFYVDNQYYSLRVFEAWLRICVDDQYAERGYRPGLMENNYYMRVKFPSEYRASIVIDKFEKDTGSQVAKSPQGPKYLRYYFKDAFPVEINSIPISYGQAELLKITVSFTYTRFMLESRSGSYGERRTTPGQIPELTSGTSLGDLNRNITYLNETVINTFDGTTNLNPGLG